VEADGVGEGRRMRRGRSEEVGSSGARNLEPGIPHIKKFKASGLFPSYATSYNNLNMYHFIE